MRRLLAHLSIRALGSFAALVGFAVLGDSLAARASGTPQQPAFRSSVDLIAVDVQVIDGNGRPIEALDLGAFEVSIAGKRRRVVTADFIRSAAIDATPFKPSEIGPVASNSLIEARLAEGMGRVYILAFDIASLTVGESRALVGSALTFIDRLQPSDRIGLYTFPAGQHVSPTTDHTALRRRVATVVGSRPSSAGFDSRFKLSPSEVIDINAEAVRATSSFVQTTVGRRSSVLQEEMVVGAEGDAIRAVQMRQCGFTDVQCGAEVRAEASALAYRLEARAVAGLNGIRSLVKLLAEYPGRKTVVLFSSGMPSSDRPGGRPDLGGLPTTLGKDAAATNTTIYTLHVNGGQVDATSVAASRAIGTSSRMSRDNMVGARALEEFSDASGGALLRVSTGSGEYALARVLRETSAHYLLGVAPEESDRDGKLRELRVTVSGDGATIRSRKWVIVPPRGQ